MARSGFTLIELLVVITIVILVSAIALPTVIPALSHRQASEAARIVSGALVGARDQAIRDNSLAGIRLLPDATLANCYSSIIPLSSPPNYQNGLVSCFPMQSYPNTVTLGTSALVLEESPSYINAGVTLPNEPTAWFWNVRVGDKVQINQAGPWYTVCGPMVQANSDGFCNNGPDASNLAPLGHEWLLLTNGRDDNGIAGIDEGWNGIDDDYDGVVDNTGPLDPTGKTRGEWEQEVWLGELSNGTTNATYVIQRRPIPGTNNRSVALPSNVVVDLSRSALPANPLLPSIDIVIEPNGTSAPVLLYSSPASIGWGGTFFQLWLSERADVGVTQPAGSWYLVTANCRSGNVTTFDQPDLTTGLIDGRKGIR